MVVRVTVELSLLGLQFYLDFVSYIGKRVEGLVLLIPYFQYFPPHFKNSCPAAIRRLTIGSIDFDESKYGGMQTVAHRVTKLRRKR